MGKTYTGQDNEFTSSTGSNVNSGGTTSDFDGQPADTTNLVIVGSDTDPTPYEFSLGESYDLSWTDSSGNAVTLSGAEVVRSDVLDSGQGVVVFQGTDDNGDLAQIVWTPNFDLDTWYTDNFVGDTPPTFYSTDQQADATYVYVCFAAGTRLAVPGGSAPVETLGPGARVRARDGGVERVLWAGRRRVSGRGAGAPVVFAPGVLGNDAPLALSQQHRVLIASPMAEVHFGAAEVFVPARALAGTPGVRLAPCACIDYVHLLLPRHDILRAAGGAHCESLHLGQVTDAILGPGLVEAAGRHSAERRPARPCLSMAEGRLLARLIARPVAA